MLKTILSISGKPGLYKLISQGRNMLIVESLTDKKRFPAYCHVYGYGRRTFEGCVDCYERERKRCCRSNGFKESYC